jgi:hypothetical protein
MVVVEIYIGELEILDIRFTDIERALEHVS